MKEMYRYLLSFNKNMVMINPEIVSNIIEECSSNKIAGVECSFVQNDEEIYNMLLLYAKCFKEKNLVFQIHGNISKNLDAMKEYLDKISNLADVYEATILVVFHSLHDEDKNISILETVEMFNEILRYVKEKNINVKVSIENLNVLNGKKRLDDKDIEKVIDKVDDLYFTYDIGHKIYDGGIEDNLVINEKLIERVINIHLHIPREGKDHYPIFSKDNYAIKTLNAIENIIDIKRKKLYKNGIYEDNKINIVLEYALDYIDGNKMMDKVINYIKLVNVLEE